MSLQDPANSPSVKMTAEQKKLIEKWRDDLRLLLRIHYDRSAICDRVNLWLAIPAVILSTVVGTSIFSSLGENPSVFVKVSIGFVSVLVSILAGLQAYLRLPERAEKHRLTAAMFAALKKEIEQNLVAEPENQEELSRWMSDVREKWEHLRREAIAIRTKKLIEYRAESNTPAKN